MTIFILTIIIALTISGVCSVLEACLLSLSSTDIANIAEKQPTIAKIWKRFKENIERPIAVILIINTLSHTIGAALSGAQFNRLFGSKGIAVFSLVFSFVMIQWTEILPKTLAVRYNRPIARFVAVPLKVLITLFTPIVMLIDLLNRPFLGSKPTKPELNAIHDISVLARFAALNNLLSKDQAEILNRTMNLSKMQVKDVMVERSEIKYLSTNMSLMDALIYAHIHHHTRLPLIEDDSLDHIVGYVNFKDIVSVLQINPANPSLKGISRPILPIYDDEPLSPLLNKLMKGSHHIAIVKSRQSGVVGVITLEDVIEAIIGEVNDEYDVLPQHCYQITGTRYVVGGGMTLQELEEKLHANFPESPLTLSEWLKGECHCIPKIEQRVTFHGIEFIIRKISRSSVHEVIIETQKT